MNGYHFVQEIDKLVDGTVVYKTRKKKTLEYFAIRKVSRELKDELLMQVKLMHNLRHENVLRFHAWYETSNHLWMVLDLAAGATLAKYAQMDGSMPEPTVHLLARDLVCGLQYLHSVEIVGVSMDPASIYFDSDGCAMFGDFGCAWRLNGRARPARVPEPPFRSPERATGQLPDVASDLWALGSLLYQLATGTVGQTPPRSATGAAPPALAAFSRDFVDLVQRCLQPDAAARITWSELLLHPFWRPTLELEVPKCALPTASPTASSPGAASGAASGGGGSAVAAAVPASILSAPSALERPVGGPSSQVGAATASALGVGVASGGALSSTPSRFAPSTPAAASGAGAMLGGSAVAAYTPDAAGWAVGPAGERTPALLQHAGPPQSGAQGAGTAHGHAVGQARPASAQQYPVMGAAAGAPRPPTAPSPVGSNDVRSETLTQTASDSSITSAGGAAGSYTPSGSGTGNNPSRATTPPRVSVDSPLSAASALAGNGARDRHAAVPDAAMDARRQGAAAAAAAAAAGAAGSGAAGGGAGPSAAMGDGRVETPVSSDMTAVESPVVDVGHLFHVSDDAVRPIVGNRRIEKAPDFSFDKKQLPFRVQAPEALLTLARPGIEEFINSQLQAVGGQTPVPTKTAALNYLCSIAGNEKVANILINSALLPALVKLVNAFKSAVLRARVAALLGLLIRHTTFIADNDAIAELPGALVIALGDANEGIRRRAAAALGELLFYASTADAGKWKANLIPGATDALSACLHTEDSPLIVHYAAKAIENVSVQRTSQLASVLATPTNVQRLLHIAVSPVEEALQLRINPDLCAVAWPQVRDGIAVCVADPSSKLQQAWVTMVGVVALRQPNLVVPADQSLLEAMVMTAENAAPVVRGKALVTLQLLCSADLASAVDACQLRMISVLDKGLRDRDEYVLACAEQLSQTLCLAVPLIVDRAAQAAAEGTDIFALSVHVMTNPILRERLVTPSLIESVSVLVRSADAVRGAQPQLAVHAMMLAEALCQTAPRSSVNVLAAVSNSLLPALVSLASATDSELRVFALKIAADTVSVASDVRTDTLALSLLPVVVRLLRDPKEPVATHAVKLLSIAAEKSTDVALRIAQDRNLCLRLPFILSAAALRLIRVVVNAGGPGSSALLMSPEVAVEISNSLRRVATAGSVAQDEFLDPLLDAIYALLFLCSTERASADSTRFDALQRASAPFANVTEALAALLLQDDATVREKASHCLLLLAQTQPASHEALMQSSAIPQALLTGSETASLLLRTLRWAATTATSGGRANAELLAALQTLSKRGDAGIASHSADLLVRLT